MSKNNKAPFWREMKSNGRKKRVGNYGKDLGERGVYDSRNKLNDLTGKEWIYFTNSIWITALPPAAAKDSGFDLRKIHPSPKPPEIMRDIIKFFTKKGQHVLDPFAGVGGTLLGASMCDSPRKAVGIELNRKYTEAYKKACRHIGIEPQTIICDDSRNMLSHKEIGKKTFDLILTDPPYCDMMRKKKNGHKKKLYGKDDSTEYSSDSRDIGNLSYMEFLEELKKILSVALTRLKNRGYLVVFCKDMQPTKNVHNMLHADMVNRLIEIPGLRYCGMRIWHDRASDLYPFGYPYAFVMNQLHQYILIFRKET